MVIYFSFLTQVVSLPSLNHAPFMAGLLADVHYNNYLNNIIHQQQLWQQVE